MVVNQACSGSLPSLSQGRVNSNTIHQRFLAAVGMWVGIEIGNVIGSGEIVLSPFCVFIYSGIYLARY